VQPPTTSGEESSRRYTEELEIDRMEAESDRERERSEEKERAEREDERRG